MSSRHCFMPFVLLGLLLVATESQAVDEVHRFDTGDGRTAVLFDDGTWAYLSDIDRDVGSSSGMITVSDSRNLVSVTYDNATWTRFPDPRTLSPDASLAFSHRDGDAYALVITERTSVPLKTLSNMVLQNARAVAGDAEMVSSEPGTVNGEQGLFVDVEATVNGIPIRYHNLVWSGDEGSVQVITFASQNLFEEYRADFDRFLQSSQFGL